MKKIDLSDFDKLSLGKQVFLVVQVCQGFIFVLLGFNALLKPMGGWVSFAVTDFSVILGALGILGSYFFLKGQGKGYGVLTAFQLLILPIFSYGDFKYEMNPNPTIFFINFWLGINQMKIGIDTFKIWCTIDQTKIGVDISALIFLVLIFVWYQQQRKPLS